MRNKPAPNQYVGRVTPASESEQRASSAAGQPGAHTAVAAAATPCYVPCILSNGACTKLFYWCEFDLSSKAPVIRTRPVLSPIDGL